jgi:hypothetical protein
MVPKTHPMTREVEADDPMELMANHVPGDPDVMLECLVQEFAWMGWGLEQLLGLFRSPEYPVLNQMLGHYGEAEIRRRVSELLGRIGVYRFRETIVEDEPDDHDDAPELIQITVRSSVRD